MSVGPLGGLAGTVAGTPLAQTKGTEVERTQQDVKNQQRRVQNDIRAENAAGIGEADGEDHQSAERDADGRRFWEESAGRKTSPTPKPNGGPPEPQSKDATGKTGSLLDLSG
jgi:hypothetical protein